MPSRSPEFNDAAEQFYSEHCIYLPAMLGWFLFSAILSSYNKYVFGNGQMHFPCPLLLTSIHFSIQWLFAHVACACFPEKLGAERIDNMSWKEWASISVPCGLITALDIGCSNLALVSITLTFYTMIKSSTPIFVLFWAYLFKIERITWPLIGVVLIIAAGEFLTVHGEVHFAFRGFALCVLASVLSGARWTLVQLKLQKMDPPFDSTIVTMKLLSPSMFWSMLILSIVIERPWIQLFEGQNENVELGTAFLLGVIGGSLAIIMIICELFLILRASAIILMIGGVIKELTTIIVGVSLFGDKLNMTNTAGVCVVFSGVALYKVAFHLEKKKRNESDMEAVPAEDLFDDDEDAILDDVDEDIELLQEATGIGEEQVSKNDLKLKIAGHHIS